MLTQAELAAIRERCERATPGPWSKKTGDLYDEIFSLNDGPTGGRRVAKVWLCSWDSLFIAHAREDMPELLGALDELKTYSTPAGVYRLNEELRADHDCWKERCEKAEKSLIGAGYTDCGGELWQPPLGPKPDFFQIDAMRTALKELAPCPTCRHNDTETFMCAVHGVYINRGCTGCDSWEFCADRFSESDSSPQ